jgi:hypothetical protein
VVLSGYSVSSTTKTDRQVKLFTAVPFNLHPWVLTINGKAKTLLLTAVPFILLMTAIATSPGTPVSSTTKTDRHDIAEILLKVALNTIYQIKSNLDVEGRGEHVVFVSGYNAPFNFEI